MFIWLGHSWVVGAEMAELITKTPSVASAKFPHVAATDAPELAYPDIVSKMFGESYVNFGRGGSSVHFAKWNLIQLIKDNTVFHEPTTVLFSHCSELRRFGRHLITKEHIHDGQAAFGIASLKDKDKYLAEDPTLEKYGGVRNLERSEFCVYDYTMALNTMYLATKQLGVNLVVYSVTNTSELNEDDLIVPPECFLESNQPVLGQEVFDNPNKYMHPCLGHANIEGNKIIADRMKTALDMNPVFKSIRQDLYK